MVEFEALWPEIFTDPYMSYHKDKDPETRKRIAIADGLCGWANCMAGSKPTKEFGEAMARLSQIVGINGSPDSFMEAADRLKKSDA